MAERKIRVLLGKLGEGHKEASLDLAKRLGDAGFEVIYTELQEPDAIVRSALQESVYHIGITTLPGADIRVFQKITDALKEEKTDYITITAGGFLDEKDISKIEKAGVMKFFPKGTPFKELIQWSKENIKPKGD
jgi:methylmalonyl-CoA mutase C-terminal domain/subunit